MRTLTACIWLWATLAFADELPEVTGLALSENNDTYQRWVQVAMRDRTFDLYAFSCQIGYTNWSFVTGGTTNPQPIFTAPSGSDLRDPAHIHYQGKYYLVYNNESGESFGVAESPDDLHWTYMGEASVDPGQYWSPKFFIDGMNCLWCNVRHSPQVPYVYPWQQYCFRFDTSNPTNTVNRDGRYICKNIWFQDNGDRPTAQIVWNNGLFYLFNQGGNAYCSPTLLASGWTQIGTNLFGRLMDGPCVAQYGGMWYITDSQNGSEAWFTSADLTNWTAIPSAGWTAFGFQEGTAIVENYLIKKVRLAWNPHYTSAQQATVITASDDLAKPPEQWEIVFTGATNECTFTNDRPVRYFSAHNIPVP